MTLDDMMRDGLDAASAVVVIGGRPWLRLPIPEWRTAEGTLTWLTVAPEAVQSFYETQDAVYGVGLPNETMADALAKGTRWYPVMLRHSSGAENALVMRLSAFVEALAIASRIPK